jgi:OmpA-OmpF porin, OOP family
MKTNHTTLRVSLIAVAVSLTLAGCSTRMGQQQNGSTVPADRQQITDKAIQERYERYEVMQTRIKQLNDTGKFPVASYSMSKAQCWLDVSFHEYTRNDRSNFPRLAFEESAKIVEYLGKGGAPSAAANPANSTPLVNDAAKLRQDLWDAANKLKGHVGFNCAAQKVACAEVELAHAGNEFNQQQWRHAKPYVQIAEDLIADAQKAAEACVPPPAPTVTAVPAPKPAPVSTPITAPQTLEIIALQANVLFNFDKRTLDEVRRYSKDQLDTVLARIKRDVAVKEVRLVGHADRLNSTGDKNYNTKLSQDRVQTIKEYLVANGVSANQIVTEFKADTQPIEACTKAKFASQAELQECLLPNRRVEVELVGVKKS